MITYLKINGFKSFHNFEMHFTPLTIVAGANASGKSNLFDALKLLSRLAETDLKTAFSEQRGNPYELFTQYSEEIYAPEMEFWVEMLVNRTIKDNWGGEAELNTTRLRYRLIVERKQNSLGFDDLGIKHESLEKIRSEEDEWIKSMIPKSGRVLSKTLRAGGSKDPFIRTEIEGNKLAIKIRQDSKQGGKATPAEAITQTVLGSVNSVDFPHVFAVKEEMRNWRFLQLNPEDLREPTRQDMGTKDTMTSSGKNLAATLFRLKQLDSYNLVDISRKLNSFLPNFIEVTVDDDKANRQYIIKLKGEDGKEFTSRVLSEGTLRLLALCILEYDDKHTGLLCFEEPENGIHPFRIKTMAILLKDLSTDFNNPDLPLRQVIVNTHSPVLVGELFHWKYDKNVSIWYSQMRTLLTNINDKRIKITITKVSQVAKENHEQLRLDFNEQERKLTLSTVREYLQTADFENVFENLD
jgi:predicted ATPase